MYDEKADFAEHLTQLRAMDEALAACKVTIDWANATVCDLGGGGGLRAALFTPRTRRSYCADVIDQQHRYNGDFVRLLAEKLQRHGHDFRMERFEFNVTDAMALVYREGLFDFVYSVNAFEHIPVPERALREAARVLRPGGIAFISFDPIWTADTGSHYQHRVNAPWAHLVLGDDGFIESMRAAGAEEWEVQEFRGAMNRVRLPTYEQLFTVIAPSIGLEVVKQWSWSGVTDPQHEAHPNLHLALRTYSREELMKRGISIVLRKSGGG